MTVVFFTKLRASTSRIQKNKTDNVASMVSVEPPLNKRLTNFPSCRIRLYKLHKTKATMNLTRIEAHKNAILPGLPEYKRSIVSLYRIKDDGPNWEKALPPKHYGLTLAHSKHHEGFCFRYTLEAKNTSIN